MSVTGGLRLVPAIPRLSSRNSLPGPIGISAWRRLSTIASPPVANAPPLSGKTFRRIGHWVPGKSIGTTADVWRERDYAARDVRIGWAHARGRGRWGARYWRDGTRHADNRGT